MFASRADQARDRELHFVPAVSPDALNYGCQNPILGYTGHTRPFTV
jgi:hypothetical protein